MRGRFTVLRRKRMGDDLTRSLLLNVIEMKGQIMIVETYQIHMGTRNKLILSSGIKVSDGKVVDSSPPTQRWIGETFDQVKEKCKKNGWKIKLKG